MFRTDWRCELMTIVTTGVLGLACAHGGRPDLAQPPYLAAPPALSSDEVVSDQICRFGGHPCYAETHRGTYRRCEYTTVTMGLDRSTDWTPPAVANHAMRIVDSHYGSGVHWTWSQVSRSEYHGSAECHASDSRKCRTGIAVQPYRVAVLIVETTGDMDTECEQYFRQLISSIRF